MTKPLLLDRALVRALCKRPASNLYPRDCSDPTKYGILTLDGNKRELDLCDDYTWQEFPKPVKDTHSV